MATPPPSDHRWYTPADCAAILLAVKHGTHWRAPCPVHGGDSTDCLSIREGRDRHGNPMTLLHCHAHHCAIEDICADMGIAVRNLFCIHPDYAQATRHAPRAHSPRIDRLKQMEEPTPDDIALILLEEMIVSDPPFILECQPARQKLWELAQASPWIKAQYTRALRTAQIYPVQFWQQLAREMGGS